MKKTIAALGLVALLGCSNSPQQESRVSEYWISKNVPEAERYHISLQRHGRYFAHDPPYVLFISQKNPTSGVTMAEQSWTLRDNKWERSVSFYTARWGEEEVQRLEDSIPAITNFLANHGMYTKRERGGK